MTAPHISPFAGSWYPEDAAQLEALLADRFRESERRVGAAFLPGAMAFVVPHAGPAYSGTVAAAVYRYLSEHPPERIVLLAFPHRGGLRGVAVPDADSISTPLGDVALEGECGGFPRVAESTVCDHSCEIQLPFLRWAAPEARLTALYVGRMDANARREAAAKLAAEWRPGTVFLASSDFTHYGQSFQYVPFPADFVIEARLRELDFACIEAAGSVDSRLFLDTIETRNANVCGTGPIALLLDVLAALGGDAIYQSVLDYQTSGELCGDFHHSVSYAALAYHPRAAFDLAEADRNALLEAAALTLRRLRGSGTRKAAVAAGSPALSVKRGVFVSLHQGKELLGCVGNHTGERRLREEVGELTLSAALDDPRFHPAASHDGPIDIELSVLTPLRRVGRTDGFQIGRHGAMIRLANRLSLLLPQVAPERGWSAMEFWRSLARKGQMSPTAWCDPRARLDLFEAQVFGRPGAE